ncbi:hypothetical protein NGTWS1803_08130 [Mycolicibacterium cyprinidarum]|nr:hypothetical protein NGTWS1803_08130 [Mycolicibacterium sp. NGTWS1803]
MQGFSAATGVVILSTALLFGGASGAIAAADTGTGDSSSHPSPTRDASSEKPASDSAASREPGSPLSGEDDSTESSAAEADTDDAIPAASDATEDNDEAAAAIDDAAVDSEQIGDQSIVDVVSTVDESEAVDSAPLNVVPEPVVPEPAASSPVASSPVASDSPDAAIVAATSTRVRATASKSAAPSVATTATTATTTVPSNGLTGGDKPAGDLDTAAVTRPPSLEDVLASMTTSMASVGDSLTTVVVTLGNTVTTVVISLGNAAAAIPPTIWALPTSKTPISDLVALVNTILASAAESAAAVMQSASAVLKLPVDIASALLGMRPVDGTTTTTPVLLGDSTDHRVDMPVLDGNSPAIDPGVAAPLLTMAPEQVIDVVDIRSGLAAFAPAGLAALAAPLKAVPASVPARAGEYQSLFDRAFGALLVPLSLWALATGALPGLLGLLVVVIVGTRVGYRQAKAGFALRVEGIARFAGSVPVGVVRSGSVVALHQRFGGHQAPHWRLSDQVA